MKLVVKEYLSGLRERKELDAVIPDLLSELGLTVFSRPKRGTRQSGVDVAAVGRMPGDQEDYVYLVSIKSGDLSRSEWDRNSDQALRPSLNEILDTYIPNVLPEQYRQKNIRIAICLGGEILEQVRSNLSGFTSQNSSAQVGFVEWNGDHLAGLIINAFMREELLDPRIQSSIRKSLAILDEPEASYKHFKDAIDALPPFEEGKAKHDLRTLRQLHISVWILISWSRQMDLFESAYRCSELATLYGWSICRNHIGKNNKLTRSIHGAFIGIQGAHLTVCQLYLDKNIRPHVDARDALVSAVQTRSSIDVKLKLFDALGRLALSGLWWIQLLASEKDINKEQGETIESAIDKIAEDTQKMIANNQILCSPILDEQCIDISLALMLLYNRGGRHEFIHDWLSRIIDGAQMAIQTNGPYPCTLHHFQDLLAHPQKDNEEYLKRVTPGSVLYPTVMLWASLIGSPDLYDKARNIHADLLSHCTFQFWYPDEDSEQHMYTNSGTHGLALTRLDLQQAANDFLKQVLGECKKATGFQKMSSVQCGFWCLVLLACRHYRYPIPLHFLANAEPDVEIVEK